MKRRQRKKEYGGERDAGNESENDGSSLVLNKVTKLCHPSLGLSCTTFYTFCPQSHISLLDSLLCLALG